MNRSREPGQDYATAGGLSQRYKDYLLDLWTGIGNAAIEARRYAYHGDLDRDKIEELAALLLQLWVELAPKMKGLNADLEKRFNAFEAFYLDPMKLMDDEVNDDGSDDTSALWKMLQTEREALEKLGVTKVEEAR